MRWLDTAIGVLAGVLLAGIALWVASSPRGHPITLEPPPPTPTTAPIAVHVAGAVTKPGLYFLHPGSRVQDAINAAGGLAPDADTDAVNLAAVLADGMRIYVPRRSTATPPRPLISTGMPPSTTPLASIDLNSADAQQLQSLPGIGPKLAQRIVEYRQKHGAFHQIDDLLKVKGIGESLLEKIKPYLTISGVQR